MSDPMNSMGGSIKPPTPASQSTAPQKSVRVQGDPTLEAMLSGKKPEKTIEEAPTPSWLNDTKPPEQAEVAEPATKPEAEKPEAEASEEEEEPKDIYKCSYYWKNDEETFNVRSMLVGRLTDECILNPELRVRYQTMTTKDRQSVDNYLPSIKTPKSEEWKNDQRGIIRLAMSVISINDQPVGETIEERIDYLTGLPEGVVQIMYDASLEFSLRVQYKTRGIQVQLKN